MSPGAAAFAILNVLWSFFELDKATRIVSVELFVLLTMGLLVLRFVCDFAGPWFGTPNRMFVVLTLEILNQNLVIYTIGLMQLSAAKVNDYFQVWAVLLVTLQYSVKVGRPYTRSKQVPLLDLMSSFWSANLLRVQTFLLLKIPLWVIWSLNAVRVVVLFVTSSKAETRNQESVRLVSDYMRYEDTLSPSPAANNGDQQPAASDAAAAKVSIMRGCKYVVYGEHSVLQEIQDDQGGGQAREGSSSSYKIRLDPDGRHKEQLVTVEKIWNNGGRSKLLGGGPAGDQRKDLCLSFALYKLLRREFYDLPTHERARPQGRAKMGRLICGYILGDCERAFRITGAELSFLRDMFYSKHSTLFAGGLLTPAMSLVLSLSLATATGYIAYPARYIPERMDPADRDRITHGVFITRLIVAIIVLKELLEIFLYVLSRWGKVLMLCMYAQHPRCLEHHPMVEAVVRCMISCGRKGKWSQTIRQQNLLVTRRVRGVRVSVLPPRVEVRATFYRGVAFGRAKLKDRTKDAILNSLIMRNLNNERPSADLDSYFTNAISRTDEVHWPRDDLKVHTHIILVWHIATCLCEIHFFEKVKALRAVRWPQPFLMERRDGDEWSEQYATAVSLSNYCAYLVRKGLVPDSGLVAGKVLGEVIRELDYVIFSRGGGRGENTAVKKKSVGGSLKLQDVYSRLMKIAGMRCKHPDCRRQQGAEGSARPDGDDIESLLVRQRPDEEDEGVDEEGDCDLHIGCSLTCMGATLGKELTDAYSGQAQDLWNDLANFWTGFLLHLAANTAAATHGRHLAGDSELITHLWALLTHAGIRGTNTIDGEQGL